MFERQANGKLIAALLRGGCPTGLFRFGEIKKYEKRLNKIKQRK